MTFFFFVVGLEARREIDLGELRERRRFALPLLAGIGGMAAAVAYLPRLQRRPVVCARLGDRDVDRHGLRARLARARRAALSRPPAGVHPDGRRRRRHRRAHRHRDRLHGGAPVCATPRGRRLFRSRPRRASRARTRRARLLRPCSRRLGRAAQVGSGTDRRRPRDGPPGLRLPGSAIDSRTRDGALPRVPRATDGGLGARRRSGAQVSDFAQRTVAAALSSLDELPDRAAVRARERGHRARPGLPGAGLQLADHARDPARLRRRQARRHSRLLVACDAI